MNKLNTQQIRAIVFDADDTLWDCQSHFEEVENMLYNIIGPYCMDPKRELFETESRNMEDLGYGCKAFTISVMETALRVCGNDLSATDLSDLLLAGKHLLQLPATPLPGVEQTLKRLYEQTHPRGTAAACLPGELTGVRLVCFTKGELQDQENKLKRSGLAGYFDDVVITSDKTQREFMQLCDHQGVHPSEMLMVGNSLKSDIAPALAIGGWAVHIPFHVTWELEHTDDFEHPRLFHIDHFPSVAKLLV